MVSRKNFDTFAPIGPCLMTGTKSRIPTTFDSKRFSISEIVQDWNTNDMIFDVPSLIEFLSGSTTLFPGTVIFTGTPHGVGMAQKPPRWLSPSESVTVVIENIGSLHNPVAVELPSPGKTG